jgi:hypothetical protein
MALRDFTHTPASAPPGVRPLRGVAAILLGNAIYFAVLLPRVPAWLQHQPFHADPGLLLDAVLCILAYWAMGLLPSRRPTES